MDFNKYNKYIGWALFTISLLVYFATMERSVSLWDCGEYIATSNKLEVGHPPGAPLFMMIGRLVSALVPAGMVALVINAVSAICSAFTILFLYWTITFIGLKLASSNISLSGNKAREESEEKKPLAEGQLWAVLFSGIIGALVYTFTDSFWFSAVEAEVYAMSSFFTAITFWAIYRWEKDVDRFNEGTLKRNPDYWIVFIMFLIGLSIGVHLLNLLAFPAIAFVYYFKKFEKTTFKGFIITGIIALVGLLIIQEVVIPKTPDWASWVEITFVNSFGLPIGSGTIFFALILIGFIVFGLLYTRRKGWVNGNTVFLSLAVLYIGYSCFTMISIRSNANPPIDENNPENLVSLTQYFKREQYGDWPLFSGPQFNSLPNDQMEYDDKPPLHDALYVVIHAGKDIEGFGTKERAEKYIADNPDLSGARIEHKYYITDKREKSVPTYQKGHTVMFPRMYSPDDRHVTEYKAWSDYPSNPELEPGREGVSGRFGNGETETVYLPTPAENFRYFFDYQVVHMFFRYFMWNFSGRQNDDHNQSGDITIGNWQTGINFIDQEMIGDQSLLPEHRARDFANNKYFLLPLILGLIGLFYQLFRNWKDWFVVLLLFIFTGLMIVVYLNQKPLEPRERDYAYAAAFYTFSIWIGLSIYALYDLARSLNWKGLARIMVYPLGAGVIFLIGESISDNHHALSYSVLYMAAVTAAFIGLFMLLKKYLKEKQQVFAIAGLALLVPVLMAFQNWDDHDRSGRYTPREMAKNYLRSCAEQAIVFTNGDNDTFPLWYVQEVEGFRTDIRTVNLSLANTDWYIDQMKRKAYDSEVLPISFEPHQYRSGNYLDAAYMPAQIINLYYGAYQNQMQGGMQMSEELKQAMVEIAKYSPGELKILVDNKIPIPAAAQKEYTVNIRKGASETVDLKFAMDQLREKKWVFPHPRISGDNITYMPVTRFKIPVDKQAIIESGMLPKDMEDQIVEQVEFSIGKNYILKADMLILELIARSEWKRPIYFAATAGKSTYLGLHDYFQMEGLVYRLVPVRSNSPYGRFNIYGNIHTEKMYAIAVDDSEYKGRVPVKEQWNWGNLNGESVYADYYNSRPVSNFRLQYNSLANALIAENKYEKAKKTLDRCIEEFPDSKIPFDNYVSYFVQSYHMAANGLEQEGKTKLAEEARMSARMITDLLTQYYTEDMAFFTTFDWKKFSSAKSADDVGYQIYQGFIVLDDLKKFNQLSTDSTFSGALVSELAIKRESNKQMFLNKLNTELTYAVENLDDEQQSKAISYLTNDLYTNLCELFVNEAFTNAQQKAVRSGLEMTSEGGAELFQQAGMEFKAYGQLYTILKMRARSESQSQDKQTREQAQRSLQLFQFMGI